MPKKPAREKPVAGKEQKSKLDSNDSLDTDKSTEQKAGLDESKEPKKDAWEVELDRMNMPSDVKEKLKEIKVKLEVFKDKIVEKFDRYIIGVGLLPPTPPQDLGAMGMQGMQASPAGMQMPMRMTPQAVQVPMQPMPPSSSGPGMAQGMAPISSQGIQAPQMQGIPSIQGVMAPPQVPPQEQVNVLVLVDDSDSKKMPKEELKSKLGTIIAGMATEVDPRFVVQTVILSEVWQSCFDGKYDAITLISQSAPVFDKGMIAAIKISELHKRLVLSKFERYIVSYVLAGSLTQGRATEKSDVDVFIVIDDTDVKRMTRAELKDKLRAIIIGQAIEAGDITGIKNKLNVQVYILTDFWDSIREANPIIFTFLRDGVPLYDRGTFMPWKQLLQMGRIRPSSEAIDMYMSSGEQILKRVAFKLKEIGMEDTFWAILTPSQAALMLYGVPPPTPKETPEVMREIFVNKLNLLEDEFVKILERNIKVRKDLEHGDMTELPGKEVDKLLSDADRYLKRINKLFEEIQKIKEKETIVALYDEVVTMARDVLRSEGIEQVEDAQILKSFETEIVNKGKMPAKHLRLLQTVVKSRKEHDAGKLTKTEAEKIKKDAAALVRILVEYIQRKRGKELERAKVRVKHGNKFGEILLLDKEAFIIHDIDAEEKEISKADVTESGGLVKIRRATIEDLEKCLASANIPPKVFIKEKMFDHLKEIFGKDVEVLINN